MANERRTASEMDQTERRVRAAMLIAGIDTFQQLAEQIDERGFGTTKLRAVNDESGRRMKRAIAEACGVSVGFFSVDFALLPELAQTPGPAPIDPRLDSRLAALETQVATLVAAVLGPSSKAPPASEAQPGESHG